MKKILCILFAVLFSVSVVGCGLNIPTTDVGTEVYRGNRKILVADQKNRCLSVYDLKESDWTDPVWTWTTDEDTFQYVDGMKYRHDNHSQSDVIAFCSSGGYCAVISYPLGEVLSYVTNAGGNPHSVEILPDGAFVVAASTGSYVRIYDTSDFGDVSENYTEISFDDAHGVLWDPEYEVLWVLGGSQLAAYEISPDHKMVYNDELSVALPSLGGHDLSAVYGNTDRLWVTTVSQVLQYSKSQKAFVSDYSGAASMRFQGNVKGIGSFEDGLAVLAIANGTWKDWNTNLVTVGTVREDGTLFDFETRKISGAIYKLRVFDKNYQ